MSVHIHLLIEVQALCQSGVKGLHAVNIGEINYVPDPHGGECQIVVQIIIPAIR